MKELQQEWEEKINRSIHGTTITSKTHHWQIKKPRERKLNLVYLIQFVPKPVACDVKLLLLQFHGHQDGMIKRITGGD